MKIGEGSPQPKKPDYRADVEKQIGKFLRSLDAYEGSQDYQARKNFRGDMDECLALMNAAINEINADALHKHLTIVKNDYKLFLKEENLDNILNLREDMLEFRDRNKL